MARKSRSTLPQLGELERVVMEHLWRVGEADVVETHGAIGDARGISVNTVGSALERLYRKKLLTRTKVSHAYRYRPVLDRDTFRARALVEAAGGMRALAREGLMSAFVDLIAQADERALDRLEQLVAQKRSKGRGP